MRITKDEVLEALTYPHLAPGQYVQSTHEINRKLLEKIRGVKMCPAAAALAIRNRGKGTVADLIQLCYEYIGDVNYRGTNRQNLLSPHRDQEIKRMKKGGYWLDLLSSEYEYLCEKYPTNFPYAKGELVKFVKSQFPVYFDMEPREYITAEEHNVYEPKITLSGF